MTREEAITVLKAFMENPLFSNQHKAAFNIAIHDIKQRHDWDINNLILINVEEMKQEQEPKTGHWYIDERPESDREVICSNCEQPIFKYHKLDFDYRPKYCPNCGCRMVEPQETDGLEG